MLDIPQRHNQLWGDDAGIAVVRVARSLTNSANLDNLYREWYDSTKELALPPFPT